MAPTALVFPANFFGQEANTVDREKGVFLEQRPCFLQGRREALLCSAAVPQEPGLTLLQMEELPLLICAVPQGWMRLSSHSRNLQNKNQTHFFLHMYTAVFWQILTCLSSNTVPSVQIYLLCQPASDPRTKQKRGFCYTLVACIAYVMNSVSKHQKPADRMGDISSKVHGSGKQEEGLSA